MSIEHFNELTPGEAERLALLMEECAEVIQMVGKIQRHGYSSFHPDDKDGANPNRVLLASEIGHVLAAVELLAQSGDLEKRVCSNSTEKKLASYKAKKYLHHQ